MLDQWLTELLLLRVQVEQVMPCGDLVCLAGSLLIRLRIFLLHASELILGETEFLCDLLLPPLMVTLAVLLLDEDKFLQ